MIKKKREGNARTLPWIPLHPINRVVLHRNNNTRSPFIHHYRSNRNTVATWKYNYIGTCILTYSIQWMSG